MDELFFKDFEIRKNCENIIVDVLLYERVELELIFYLWIIIYCFFLFIGMKELFFLVLNFKRFVKEIVLGELILIVILFGVDFF